MQHEQDIIQSEQAAHQPIALLYFTDLMFGVQLQTIARHAGYTTLNLSVRPGAAPAKGDLLVVDIAARGDWEGAIRQAKEANIPVIAFGPHVDAEARKRAKRAGATRLLANSNLAERLPTILLGLRNSTPAETGDTDHANRQP